jgi:hypothetical protein
MTERETRDWEEEDERKDRLERGRGRQQDTQGLNKNLDGGAGPMECDHRMTVLGFSNSSGGL